MKNMISFLLISSLLFLFSCGNKGNGSEGKKDIRKGKAGQEAEASQNQSGNAGNSGNTSPKIEENPYYKTSPATIKGYLNNGIGLNIIVDMLPSAGDIVPLSSINVDENAYFETNVLVTEPSIYQLRFGHANVHLFLRGGETIEFIADVNFIGDYKISGSEESVQLREMYTLLNTYNHKVSDVQDRFDRLKQNSKDNHKIKQQMFQMYDSLNIYYAQIAEEKSESIRNFITRIDTSMVAMMAAMKLNMDEDYDFVAGVRDKFGKMHPYSAYFKELDDKVNKMIPIVKGKAAPEISMDNPAGKMKTLSSLRGKVVVLYFWAGFDQMAAEVNEKLKAIYKKHAGSGLEVYAVSVDNERESWVSAIEEQDLPWINVSNLYGWDEQIVGEIYRITEIPYFIVIDRQGIIYSKGDKIHELENSIRQIL